MFTRPVLHFGSTLLLLVVATLATAQDATSPDALTEREEVTAVDLVVELSKKGGAAARPPYELTPDDFVLEERGRPLTIVGIDGPQSTEPWHLLIYVDLGLSSAASTRWAVSALAESAAALTELGEVEIVVSDPDPRVILAPSRNAVLVDQMLSGIFLDNKSENGILSLREEFLLQREEEDELSTPQIVDALIAEELRLVGLYQDAVLDTVIAELPGTSRRALFLVSEGFDQKPEIFYGEYGQVDDRLAGVLEATTREWAETIAAYGWSVIALEVGEATRVMSHGVVPTPDERTLAIRTPGLAARLDGSLDPEKAAAHHELGQRLAEQGDLEAARTSLNEALRFYHEHPKYSRQRAAVLADLGKVLQGLERLDEARLAMRQAVDLDPERESAYPFIRARLETPEAALELLADSSGGHLVEGAEGLSAAITGLNRRLRLTFQLPGVPDGELHPVTARLREGTFDVRGPTVMRFGTPPSVSDLRARRLLAGEEEKGTLATRCRFVEASRTYSSRTGSLEIEVSTPDPESSLDGRELRVTIGIAGEEGPSEIRRERITLEEGSFSLPLEVEDDDVWLSVIVDDPATAEWGGATTEL